MTVRRIPRRQTERARRLRNDATPQERALWALLSRYRPKFTRQLSIDPHTVDLAHRQARLVIEIDGSQHAGSVPDEMRTRVLEAQGWKVVRFWNSDVNANPEGVAEAILVAAAERLGAPLEAIPSRAGRARRSSR
jgi:very-short-patch-repair endonuclease